MYGDLKEHLRTQLREIEEAGLFKRERIITTPQDAVIKTTDGEEVLNFLCEQLFRPELTPESA